LLADFLNGNHILYADGNILALVVSGLLILILIGLIVKKNRQIKSEVDFLKVYQEARDGNPNIITDKSFEDLPELP